MLDSEDDGYLNDPWTDHRSSSPTTVVAGSSTQYHSRPTSLHRRKSKSVLRQHSRAQTETYTRARSTSSSHPLRGLSDGSGTESRPNLARLITGLTRRNSSDAEEEEAEVEQRTKGKQKRREELVPVIVHEVTTADSLAGVSLKYGISLADLRRANHLWASDSIHLRRTLYIPVDKSRHSLPSAANLIDFDESESPPLPRPEDPNIRHIPASELSFFPPPTLQSRPVPIRPSITHSASQSSSVPLSLNSILSSTRDNIIARLSLDSGSSSFSDRSTSVEEEEGHELALVSPSRRRSDEVAITSDPVTPKAAYATPTYSPEPVRRKRFRIDQMEPSPAMQIPNSRTATGNLVDFSIDDDDVHLR